jgi:hypothetical protein
MTPLEITQSKLPSPHRQALDPALLELDLIQTRAGGKPPRLVQLLNREVDADHPTRRSHQRGGDEGVHPGAAAQVDHPLPLY